MGPLTGLKVVEMASIGPIPFCGMVLSDLGADVIRIDRTAAIELGQERETRFEFTRRGRGSVALDLKTAEGVKAAMSLIAKADILVEGFRPGVMERLGLGPRECHDRNPRLVYGRMTGWGQSGPLANAAGHDINYIALAGALHCVAREGEAPVAPLNLLGDYGGGAMFLLLGVVSAIFEATRSGRGQVVDAAMVDGVAALMTHLHGLQQGQYWSTPGQGRKPWYDVYRTLDARYVSVGAVEERFYRVLVEKMGLDFAALPDRRDSANAPALRKLFTEIFARKTQQEWSALMEGSQACFAPVLTPAEAREHPHAAARECFASIEGLSHPMPAPRFSRSSCEPGPPGEEPGHGAISSLRRWNMDESFIGGLRAAGAIRG